MDQSIGVDLGAIIWLALILAGAALIVGGIIMYRGGKSVLVRALAGAAVAVGVVMWAVVLFLFPAYTTENQSQSGPTAAPFSSHPNLSPPEEAQVQSTSGAQGNREDTREGNLTQLMETELDLDQLLDHYRQQIQHNGWEPSPALKDESLATLTWTYLDENRPLARGILTIALAEENRWLISETFLLISP